MPSDSGVLATSAGNLSEQAHEVLKRDILAAALLPGERLRLDALSAVGFVDVATYELKGDPMDLLYVARPPS